MYLISPLQITVYLGKRDFVDHVGEVDPIGELGREGEREGEGGGERREGGGEERRMQRDKERVDRKGESLIV